MEKPVFKTFASAEGLMEILKSSFLALMLALSAASIEPSQKAIEMTDRLKNNREVSCCELKSEYRRMALELHPDKGGTDEDMAYLNNARDAREDCSQQKMRGCSRTSSSSTKSSKGKSKKTQEKSFDSGRLFAGGVVAGGVVGLVVSAMDGRKSPKPHVRTPTSPRHR